MTTRESSAIKTWKWICGLLGSLLLLTVISAGSAFFSLKVEMTKVQTTLVSIQKEISEATRDRYTGRDHDAYAKYMDSEIAAMNHRIANLENMP